MSGNNPEWFYCFICDKKIEDGQAARFVPEENRKAHEKCLRGENG